MTGFLGVGGGFLAVPALVSVLAVPMGAAVGTSLLVVLANALVALGARAGTAAHVDLALLLPFLAAAFQIIVGGVLVFLAGILIGSS